MSQYTSNKQDNNWMSFSDIMTGLMVIFMFIAISYISEVQKEQETRDIVFEEFKATKDNLYAELQKEFKEDFKDWKVQLDKDLSIKFTNEKVLFASGEEEIKPLFARQLESFLPRYFNILLQPKYRSKISEIRIEGHTDTRPIYRYDDDAYIGNVKLSQARAASVLKFLRFSKFYDDLSTDEHAHLQFWLTANGLSYGRTLDDNKVLTYKSNMPINSKNSRRVEFRVVTTSDELIQRVLNEMMD